MQAFNCTKMESNPINCGCLRKPWQHIVEVPNETLVNLVLDIFKLSTSRQVSLSGCTFGQKDLNQVAQAQISPDEGARPILTLVYQFWTHQF